MTKKKKKNEQVSAERRCGEKRSAPGVVQDALRASCIESDKTKMFTCCAQASAQKAPFIAMAHGAGINRTSWMIDNDSTAPRGTAWRTGVLWALTYRRAVFANDVKQRGGRRGALWHVPRDGYRRIAPNR